MSEQFDIKSLEKDFEAVRTGVEAIKSDVDKLHAEKEAKGAADVVLSEKVDKAIEDIMASQKRLDEFEVATKRKSVKMIDKDGNEIDLDTKAANWATSVARQTKSPISDFASDQMTEYKSAYERLLRKNMDENRLTPDERKALSVGVDSAGGYFVHPDMTGRIVAQIYETSPIRAYASVQIIGTDRLHGYYDNDEVGFGWAAELEARAETTTPAVGKWEIPVHEMYAFPFASQQSLDDAEIDLESWLSGKIADKFNRAENTAFTTGAGTDRPRGFLTYADGTDLTNSVEQVGTGVSADFAAAPNGGDTLITALYKLKAQYRGNATWFMSSLTQGAFLKEKDSDGRMIWQPSAALGAPATIFGRPVATFEDMPTIAANSLSIMVGDLRQAYQIVERFGIRMLRDPYTSKPRVGFYATKRVGGDMINGEAIKLIKFG